MTESKVVLTDRLRKEGRWEEASVFKDEVLKELKGAGVRQTEAREKAWEEMGRFYRPLPVVKAAEEGPEAELPAADAEAVEAMIEKIGEGLAPVDLLGDIRWVYQQLENKRVRPDQAPSPGAWSLLAWARKYQSRFFEQLLPKALAKAPEEDELVRREKRSIAEIEEILDKLKEAG